MKRGSALLLLALAVAGAEQGSSASRVPRARPPATSLPALKPTPPQPAKTDSALVAAAQPPKAAGARPPSFLWAVLHGWLYMFSIALAAGNLPFLIRTIVNPDGANEATPAAIKVSGDVEAVDKALPRPHTWPTAHTVHLPLGALLS